MRNSRKRLMILQPYLTPYRLGLFNSIQSQPDISLTLCYFSRPERRRQWKISKPINFAEKQLWSLVLPKTYETNKVYTNVFHLLWITARVRPDAIICCSNREGRILALCKALFRYKLIFWTEVHHKTVSNSNGTNSKLSNYCKQIDSYIVPGKLSAEYVIDRCKAKLGDIFFAPNTVDDRVFHSSSNEISTKFMDNKLRFLFCGNLTKAKGFDLLLRSIRLLNNNPNSQNYHFHILGDGPIEKKQLSNVTFHGYCDTMKCVEIMSKTHVFVLPSLRDCNPLTVLETAKMGHVLLLSDAVGNHPEFIPRCGSIFSAGNFEALHSALLKTLETPRLELQKVAEESRLLGEQITHNVAAEAFLKALNE